MSHNICIIHVATSRFPIQRLLAWHTSTSKSYSLRGCRGLPRHTIMCNSLGSTWKSRSGSGEHWKGGAPFLGALEGGAPFCIPPVFYQQHAGHNCDTGVGKPTLTQMPQIQHGYLTSGSQHMAYLKRHLPTGIGEEALPTGERGGKVGVINCNHRLQDPPLPHILLKVTWESPVGIG